MPYLDVFDLFWKQVIESVEENRFAKLTMAKTIGKPNLRNIFLKPIYAENDFKVLLKFRYRSTETEDQEDELTLEEAFVIVKSHLRKSFSTVLLFTTTKDVTFKINKKGAGSITESFPTFKDVQFEIHMSILLFQYCPTFVAINIVGDAANAQLNLEYETFSFVDFMHLMKIDGAWKIISKTYTTVQKDF